MKSILAPSLGIIALAASLMAGCNEEEQATPVMQPVKQENVKPTPAPAAQAATADEPELVSIQSLAGTPKAEEKTPEQAKSPAASGQVQQQESGSFVIQVSIQPSKKAANAIVKKLADNGIKAYIAEVENPGELEGTYYRVRVGFFQNINAAQDFGKQVLTSLNFAWWVDNSSNDEVGQPEGSYSDSGEESSSYYAPPQDTPAQEEPAPQPSEQFSEPEPAQAEQNSTEPSPAQEPTQESAPEVVEEKAQAPAAPPAPAADDFVDDWE